MILTGVMSNPEEGSQTHDLIITSDVEVVLGYNTFVIFSSVFMHMATLIAFGFMYKVRPKARDLTYSLLGLIVIYFVISIFTAPVDGVNYVSLLGDFSILWIPVVFLIVVLPTYWFQILVYRYFVK